MKSFIWLKIQTQMNWTTLPFKADWLQIFDREAQIATINR